MTLLTEICVNDGAVMTAGPGAYSTRKASSYAKSPGPIWRDESQPLQRELLGSMARFGKDRDLPAVEPAVLARAIGVGFTLIRELRPVPHALNMTASADGDILFTLFGKGQREAEIWVERASPGRATVVLIDGEVIREETIETAPHVRLSRVTSWLRGEVI